MGDEVRLRLGGESTHLLGGRALFLPEHAALLIADLHLGKADTFRRAGLSLPAGGTSSDLQRLQRLVQQTGCRQLWMLGDMLHGALHRAAWHAQWLEWRRYHPALEVHVVRGNHDRALSPQLMQAVVHEGEAALGPFRLRHEPDAAACGHVIAGHLHPLVALPGIRRRLPAFWLREGITVLPAFSRFTAGVVPRLQPGERLVACVEDTAVLLPVKH